MIIGNWLYAHCSNKNLQVEEKEFKDGKLYYYTLKIANDKWKGQKKETAYGAKLDVIEIAEKALFEKEDWENKMLPDLMLIANTDNKNLIRKVFNREIYYQSTFNTFVEVGKAVFNLHKLIDRGRYVMNPKYDKYFYGNYELYTAFIGAICEYVSVEDAFEATRNLISLY